MADRYAKEMASKILKREIIAPRNISVNDCYKIASDIVHELYYEDFTSATREFCYPCWTFTVKLYNF